MEASTRKSSASGRATKRTPSRTTGSNEHGRCSVHRLLRPAHHGTHSIVFARGRTLRLGKTRCSGWCDDKSLKVATGAAFDHWLGVLVHETCHIDQIRAWPRWFHKAEIGLARLDAWLQGGKPVKVRRATLESIKLEHDCEARSVAKIRRHKLPIDLPVYIQKANAYLLGYHVTLRERKWCFRAYREKSIWGRMPKRLLSQKEVLKPNPELLALFK